MVVIMNLQSISFVNNFSSKDKKYLKENKSFSPKISFGVLKDEYIPEKIKDKKEDTFASKVTSAIISRLGNPNNKAEENHESINEVCRTKEVFLSQEDRKQILSELGLTKSELYKLSNSLSNVDDKTFVRCTLLIKNGASYNPNRDFNLIKELDDEQYQRALEITKAGNMPFSMAGAYRAANLDDFTYSRWLTFKENEGILSFEEGRIPPEKLADLDDDSFQNAVSMIPVLKSSNYIVPIASNPNLYRNAQKLIKAGALNSIKSYQQRSFVLSKLSGLDDKKVDKFIELLRNGAINDENGSHLFASQKLSDNEYAEMLAYLKTHPGTNIQDLYVLF